MKKYTKLLALVIGFIAHTHVQAKNEYKCTVRNFTDTHLYGAYYYDMGSYFERSWSEEKGNYATIHLATPGADVQIVKPPRKRRNFSLKTHPRHLLITEQRKDLQEKISLDNSGQLPRSIVAFRTSDHSKNRDIICENNIYRDALRRPIPSCFLCGPYTKEQNESCKFFLRKGAVPVVTKEAVPTKSSSSAYTPPNSPQ